MAATGVGFGFNGVGFGLATGGTAMLGGDGLAATGGVDGLGLALAIGLGFTIGSAFAIGLDFAIGFGARGLVVVAADSARALARLVAVSGVAGEEAGSGCAASSS